ncbi:HlyD family efflux transporter periplasmic adaptor subunit [Rhodanobacter sp. DHB23]|uniref:efflux RND transporter periplasmic adaptor subunit n=1 Tax=Rhodanobacter sp. DHB23 TaxID=2775923 RepID=UPI0017873A4C|nr:HlyD family efflux transporter periplasmic adaptor subunit [Rhodanobacter sp. DHB23]MBD8874317.1 HlyD family efflux transporter periplasmic adaptor subunit [Rhodanobacter sp. DHB23]
MKTHGAGLLCLLSLSLGACRHAATDGLVLERAQPGPLQFTVHGEGELQSTHPTPLLVPGTQWTSRQLSWMLPDGSRVEKGELVARFSAEQSKQDLAEAEIDLDRNTLERTGKQAELAVKRGQLGVDLTQVETQYAIAERYANVPLEAMARNDILDAVQDAHYLEVRQRILQWREQQSTARGEAELAVLDAQRSNYATLEKQKQGDLDALELRAPHAGVLMLERNWAQQLPQVGGTLFAGDSFAKLPDLDTLEVELFVPQLEARGIRVGDAVELHRWGAPAERASCKIDWVAAAAQPRSQESPVKYLALKASVPLAVARRYGWVPGQRFDASIVLLQVERGYSVPNLALGQDGDQATVQVLADGRRQTRRLELGVRGPTRTQVLAGLQPGDAVLLAAAAKEAK